MTTNQKCFPWYEKWRFRICINCAKQSTPARRAILLIAVSFALLGMLYVFPHPIHAETATDAEIADLQRRFIPLDGIPTRVAVLESQMSELVYWARGIGTALGLAILERAIKAFGIVLRKSQENPKT